MMISADNVLKLHSETVTLWHTQSPANTYERFLGLVCMQHMQNFMLWHEEDKARSKDADDSVIASVKRAIDQLNQKRNDAIETIDEYLLKTLTEKYPEIGKSRPINTETPGSVIDRLSILSLRPFHMNEQTERRDTDKAHQEKVDGKLIILHEQQKDLSNALQNLLNDLLAGAKQLKIYRQFKMYNDPTLNPYLYN